MDTNFIGAPQTAVEASALALVLRIFDTLHSAHKFALLHEVDLCDEVTAGVSNHLRRPGCGDVLSCLLHSDL